MSRDELIETAVAARDELWQRTIPTKDEEVAVIVDAVLSAERERVLGLHEALIGTQALTDRPEFDEGYDAAVRDVLRALGDTHHD